MTKSGFTPGVMVVVWSLALMTGCVGQVPEHGVVRVEVPVRVPCRAPVVAEPVWMTASLQAGDSLEVKVRALLAERWQAQGYIVELEAAVGACR